LYKFEIWAAEKYEKTMREERDIAERLVKEINL